MLVLGIVGVVAVGACAYWLIDNKDTGGGGGSGPRATTSTAASPACTPVSLSVAVDPQYQAAVEKVAQDFRATDPCAEVEVVATTGDAMLADMKAGTASADVWVADGVSWVDVAQAAGHQVLGLTTVATTPVVLAVPTEAYQALGWDRALTAEQIAPLLAPDWTWTKVGKDWGAFTVRATTGPHSSGGIEPVAALLENTLKKPAAGMGDNSTDDWSLIAWRRAFAAVSDPTGEIPWGRAADTAAAVALSGAVVTTEAAVGNYDAGSPTVRATAGYLTAPARSVEITAARLAGTSGSRGTQADRTAADFVTALSTAGQETWALSHARSMDGTEPGFADSEGLSASAPVEATAPSLQMRTAAQSDWAWVHRKTSTLAVFDWSGSMQAPFPHYNGSRWDLLIAALMQAMAYGGVSDYSGVTLFHTEGGAPAVRNVVPLQDNGTLADPQSNVSQALVGLSAIPVSGDTPLYRAIMQSYRTAVKSYAKGRVNQMIVLTDGQEDCTDTYTVQDVITRIKTLQDQNPKKPVKLTLIGLGEDANMSDLYAIAGATGADVYHVSDPREVSSVVASALYGLEKDS